MSVNTFPRRFIADADFAKTDKDQLYPFDPTRGDGRINLSDLVGKEEVDAIISSKSIEFLATGDSGKGLDTAQSQVIEAMSHEFVSDNPALGATFFMHLGDIIYGPNKQANYANKFYRPNMSWLHPAPGIHGIILGIPGNHDGEVRDKDDNPSLGAFLDNFCKRSPEMAASFGVTMPNQPGPYWWLSAPFLDLIGLYSNAAEDFGTLGINDGDTKQQEWLAVTLSQIKKNRDNGIRNGLVFATHHPPYNQGLNEGTAGHPGSPMMLAQIDSICEKEGIWPDFFISGHSHNYQRYMRTIVIDGNERDIPYLIAGTGGIGSQPAPRNIGNKRENVLYAAGLGAGGDGSTVYGYLRMHCSESLIQATFVQTISTHRDEFETVAIDLKTGKRTTPDFN